MLPPLLLPPEVFGLSVLGRGKSFLFPACAPAHITLLHPQRASQALGSLGCPTIVTTAAHKLQRQGAVCGRGSGRRCLAALGAGAWGMWSAWSGGERPADHGAWGQARESAFL